MKVGFMSPLKDNLTLNAFKSIHIKENKTNISIDDKRNSSKILKHKNNNQFKVKLPNIEPQTNKNLKQEFLNIFHHKGKSIFENHLLDCALGTINSVEFNSLTREQNNKMKVSRKITNSFKNEKSILITNDLLDTNFSNRTSNKNSNNNNANSNISTNDNNSNKNYSNNAANRNMKIFEDNSESLKRNKSLRVDVFKNRIKNNKKTNEPSGHIKKNSFDNSDILNLVRNENNNYKNENKINFIKDLNKFDNHNQGLYCETNVNGAEANYFHLISDAKSENELDSDSDNNEYFIKEQNINLNENNKAKDDLNQFYMKSLPNNHNEILNLSKKNFLENYNNNLYTSQKHEIILGAETQKENYAKANNADLNLINDYILTKNEINFINKHKNNNNKNINEYGSNINCNKTINLNIYNNTIANDNFNKKTTEEFGTQYNCDENLTDYKNKENIINKKQIPGTFSLNKNNNLTMESLTYSPIKSPSNKKFFNKIYKSNEKDFIRIDKMDKLSNIIFNQNINININNFNSSNFINFNNFCTDPNNNLTSFKNYLDKFEIDRIKDKYFLSPMNRQKDFRNNYYKYNSNFVFNSAKKGNNLNNFNNRNENNKKAKKTEADKEKPEKKKFINKIEM